MDYEINRHFINRFNGLHICATRSKTDGNSHSLIWNREPVTRNHKGGLMHLGMMELLLIPVVIIVIVSVIVFINRKKR